jgi:hypothetical protein
MKKATARLQRKKKGTPRALPREESDFTALLEHDAVVRGAFLYEYFRASEKLRGIVEEYQHYVRQVEAQAAQSAPKRGTFEPIGTALARRWAVQEPFRPAMHAVLDQSGIPADMHGTVITLAHCPGFPTKAAVRIDPLRLALLADDSAVRSCPAFDQTNMERWVAMGNGQAGIEYSFRGSYRAQDFESVFSLVVDWRRSDAQIRAGLESVVIKKRPEQFAQFARVPELQSPLWSRLSKLGGFTPRTALNWLGVLRRFESCERSWQTYLTRYETGAKRRQFELNERSQRHRASFENWQRQRQNECQNARILLAWLESGAMRELSRGDFRRSRKGGDNRVAR